MTSPTSQSINPSGRKRGQRSTQSSRPLPGSRPTSENARSATSINPSGRKRGQRSTQVIILSVSPRLETDVRKCEVGDVNQPIRPKTRSEVNAMQQQDMTPSSAASPSSSSRPLPGSRPTSENARSATSTHLTGSNVGGSQRVKMALFCPSILKRNNQMHLSLFNTLPLPENCGACMANTTYDLRGILNKVHPVVHLLLLLCQLLNYFSRKTTKMLCFSQTARTKRKNTSFTSSLNFGAIKLIKSYRILFLTTVFEQETLQTTTNRPIKLKIYRTLSLTNGALKIKNAYRLLSLSLFPSVQRLESTTNRSIKFKNISYPFLLQTND